MSQIRITPDTMRERSSNYLTKQGDLDSLRTELENLVTTLETEWEGAATVSFREQWEAIKPSFENCSTLLGDISSQLNSTADAMETLDADISSQMGIQ